MHIAALKGLELAAADEQFAAITDAIGLHADINNRIVTYSGGMRRRLIFAQALLGTPRLLVLDEPTAELDRETARRVSALVVERARTAAIVMTTHLAEEIASRPPRSCASRAVAWRRHEPGRHVRSSLLTSLTRYSYSWGLWLLLLIAPIGARFMIARTMASACR
jgi:ABC-type nitrate/sulfonate/bicarbonate transport system ATPase subunit